MGLTEEKYNKMSKKDMHLKYVNARMNGEIEAIRCYKTQNKLLEVVIHLFNKINSIETNKIEYTDEEVKEIAEVLREV